MTSYQEITEQIVDQWASAFKAIGDNVVGVSDAFDAARGKIALPAFPNWTALTGLSEVLSKWLPTPSEAVDANFELTSRLLGAQRELALQLLETGSRAAGSGQASAGKTGAKAAKKN